MKSFPSDGRDFIIAELQRTSENLYSARDAADKMVRNFLTLVTAVIGGLGAYGHFFDKDLRDIALLLLVLGSVILSYGISVFVLLLSRNYQGRIYNLKVSWTQCEISKKYELPIFREFDELKQDSEKNIPWIKMLGGSGMAIACANSVIAAYVGHILVWWIVGPSLEAIRCLGLPIPVWIALTVFAFSFAIHVGTYFWFDSAAKKTSTKYAGKLRHLVP